MKNPMLDKFMAMKDHLTPANIHEAGAMAAVLLAEHEFAEMAEEKMEKTGDHIEDELHGAEEYITMWAACTDPAKKAELKQMAHDEVRHSEYFMREAYAQAKTPEDKAELESKKMWHDSLMARLR